MLDLAFKALGNDEVFPKFYDAMTRVDYTLSAKHTLSVHVLHSGDRTDINNSPEGDAFDQYQTKYDNTYSWLTLKSAWSSNLYSRTLVYGGSIHHNRSGGFDKYENSDKGSFTLSDIRTYSFVGMKQDWNWNISNRIFLNSGFELKHAIGDYDYTSSIHELRVDSNEVLSYFDRDLDIQLHPTGQQIGLYISGRYKLLDRLIAETGFRYDHTTYTGDRNISPRISLAYAFDRTTILRAAWGHYYQSQFINSIDVNNGNTTFNPAELAKHYVLGFEHKLKNNVQLRVEAYYKDLSHISPLWQNMRDHLEVYPEARNDNARVIFNGITSKGLEVFLKYDEGGKFSWWFSYAFARAEDDIKDIQFNGLLTKRTGKVPRLNDQRHTIYADVNYRPNHKWHFNLSWNYYQGWPRTDYTYRIQTLSNGDLHFYPVHLEFNGTTYPAYHRMDIRANRHFTLRHGKCTVFIQVINAYNRENLKKFDLDTTDDNDVLSVDANGNYVPFEDNKYWLGITPIFGASWSF
ncbi:MAG: TonB-dependent receptor [Saprospiraceae bacterium]